MFIENIDVIIKKFSEKGDLKIDCRVYSENLPITILQKTTCISVIVMI